MPKVKKKTTRPRKRKTTKSRTKAKAKASLLSRIYERAGDLLSHYTIAAAAGLTVVGLIGAAMLWSGGYVGLMGERIGAQVDRATVAAGFEVRRITAKGFENANEAEILSALGPVIGSSLLQFDPYAARARVEELGWVRTAAVSRLWPDTVHVSVREREAAAVWQLAGAMHLIDEDGAVIREVDAYEYSNLPLIVGAGAPASAAGMLRALRGEAVLWGRAAALIRVGDRRWNVRLKSGADVKFPEAGYEAAVRDLAVLQNAYGLLDLPLDYIDLRDPDRLVYRENDGDEKPAPGYDPL
jgi:cell division protein FtsQ